MARRLWKVKSSVTAELIFPPKPPPLTPFSVTGAAILLLNQAWELGVIFDPSRYLPTTIPGHIETPLLLPP